MIMFYYHNYTEIYFYQLILDYIEILIKGFYVQCRKYYAQFFCNAILFATFFKYT
jgi:hypothetical protein